MESYSVGEKVYLRYKVENLGNKDFIILQDTAMCKLSLNGKLVDEIKMDVNGHELGFMFCPEEKGQYAADIWYEVPVGSVMYDPSAANAGATDTVERRTVRFLIPVVR